MRDHGQVLCILFSINSSSWATFAKSLLMLNENPQMKAEARYPVLTMKERMVDTLAHACASVRHEGHVAFAGRAVAGLCWV